MSQLIRGQYELLEKLGTGGMGEVFKARDTKLNRFVAVKILKTEQSMDSDQRRRFLQEAQAASALNHPHIIVIHDVISDNGVDYMVMEHVEGKTLAQLIPPGGMPVAEVVNLGMQIAEGLWTAHQAGIIHRDLKPGNLMVTNTGRVKILDFGLAKIEAAPSASDPEATLLQSITMQGSIIGTLCYMSPEQAQAMRVDCRTDIFSFGAVLYEMASGQRAFKGENPISTLSSVLRDQPPSIQTMNAGAPPQLQSLIESCLKKDPAERTQTMREIFDWLTLLKKLSDSGTLHSVVMTEALKEKLAAPVLPSAAAIPAAISIPEKMPKNRKRALIGIGAALLAIFAFRGREHKIVTVDPPASIEAQGLTTKKIIEMMENNVSIPVIIDQIRASGKDFDVSADDILKMAKADVPDAVIEAMRNRKGAPVEVEPTAAPAKTSKIVTAAKPGRTVTLADATPIALELDDDIPLIATEGQALTFTSVVDVKAEDIVVIARGAKARGAIYSKGKKKQLIVVGRGTKVTFELTSIDASGGGQIKLRATPAAKDDESRVFEMKSKLMIATKGTSFIAYVAGKQEVVTAAK